MPESVDTPTCPECSGPMKLRTAQRLANLIAVFCILSWRVFWMTMLNVNGGKKRCTTWRRWAAEGGTGLD